MVVALSACALLMPRCALPWGKGSRDWTTARRHAGGTTRRSLFIDPPTDPTWFCEAYPFWEPT